MIVNQGFKRSHRRIGLKSLLHKIAKVTHVFNYAVGRTPWSARVPPDPLFRISLTLVKCSVEFFCFSSWFFRSSLGMCVLTAPIALPGTSRTRHSESTAILITLGLMV